MTNRIRKPPRPKGDESAAEYRKRVVAAQRILNEQADAWPRSLLPPKWKEPRWLKFRRNLCYKGVDYGPDYPQDVALVDGLWAWRFVRDGDAVEIDAPPQEVSRADSEFDLDDALTAALTKSSGADPDIARRLLISASDMVTLIEASRPEDKGKPVTLETRITLRSAIKAGELSAEDRKLLKELRSLTTKKLLRWTKSSTLQSMTFRLERIRNPEPLPENTIRSNYMRALKPWKEFNNKVPDRNNPRLCRLNFFTPSEAPQPFVIPADWT